MLSFPLASGGSALLEQELYYIQEEWDGTTDSLHFTLPIGHPQRPAMTERLPLTDKESGQSYVITTIDEGKSDTSFTAALDLDALQAEMLFGYTNGSSTPALTISGVLPTGWTVRDHSGITFRRTIAGDLTPLDVIRQCMETYDGLAVRILNGSKEVHLYRPDSHTASGAYYTDELNLTAQPQYKGAAKDEDFYTRLYPVGKDGLTIESVNDGKGYVECHDYTDRVICRMWKDDRFTVAENLRDAAQAMVNTAGVPARSYECSVLDLAKIDPAKYAYLGAEMYKVVTLIDRASGKRLQHKVARYRRYPHRPDKNVLTLSTVPGTVTKRLETAYSAVTDTAGTTAFQQRQNAAIEAATQLITGALGGHFIITEDANGKPDGWAIMDTAGTATAQKVWRMTAGGLGYSKNGWNGPYETAITADGQIVADFITAGTITANLIRAGILASMDGSFSLDLSSGKMSATNGTFETILTKDLDGAYRRVVASGSSVCIYQSDDGTKASEWLCASFGGYMDGVTVFSKTGPACMVNASGIHLSTDGAGFTGTLNMADGMRQLNVEKIGICDSPNHQPMEFSKRYISDLGCYVLASDGY